MSTYPTLGARRTPEVQLVHEHPVYAGGGQAEEERGRGMYATSALPFSKRSGRTDARPTPETKACGGPHGPCLMGRTARDERTIYRCAPTLLAFRVCAIVRASLDGWKEVTPSAARMKRRQLPITRAGLPARTRLRGRI